jgi:mRNA-degrading endonuclease toxin of MazEF toxin-antitoxin module
MAVSRASCKPTSSSIECVLRSSRDARGHEHRGLRYAVVLQSDYLAELSPAELAEADAALRIVLSLR